MHMSLTVACIPGAAPLRDGLEYVPRLGLVTRRGGALPGKARTNVRKAAAGGLWIRMLCGSEIYALRSDIITVPEVHESTVVL
jgi:hypothetical protein